MSETDGDRDCVPTLVVARENVGILCENERTFMSASRAPCGGINEVGLKCTSCTVRESLICNAGDY